MKRTTVYQGCLHSCLQEYYSTKFSELLTEKAQSRTTRSSNPMICLWRALRRRPKPQPGQLTFMFRI
jgi:hypothetical protein